MPQMSNEQLLTVHAKKEPIFASVWCLFKFAAMVMGVYTVKKTHSATTSHQHRKALKDMQHGICFIAELPAEKQSHLVYSF